MTANDWQTEQFERNRAHLVAVAERILGSAAEADDAVQETWLRFSAANTTDVGNRRGGLRTVTSRICLEALRARRARREELIDGWLPEPVAPLEEGGDPQRGAVVGDLDGPHPLRV